MSEKHLTEQPWKQLATKQKLKDPGLGKALAAYGKAGEQDYDARLAALDEIKSQAGDLLKEHKKDKDVSGYLGEVLKEVDKTRKAIEDLQKNGGGEADDGEAEEYKKDLKKKLVSALAQVKGRAPGAAEPGEEGQPQLQFMAYVASGASAVIVAKKVGGATKKLLPEIAGGASGGKYIQGECIFEKNVHTFVVEKVPGGLAKRLSKALLAETGIKYKVRVRSLDGAQELDSDTDTDAGETAETPAPATSLEAQWKQLKAALYPEIKKALEANPPNRNEIVKLAGEASQQEKAANFQGAIDALTKLRPLLKGSPTASAIDPKQLMAVLTKLTPLIKNAVAAEPARKNEILTPVAEFQALLKAGQLDQARAKILAVGALLKTLGAQQPQPGAKPTGATADSGPTLTIWQQAKDAVDAQLMALYDKLRKSGLPVLREVADEIEGVLGNFRTSLIVALTEYDQASGPKKEQARSKASQVVTAYQASIPQDKHIIAADTNPFGVKITVRQTLGDALATLSTRLKAA
jgi:hypothetical protein